MLKKEIEKLKKENERLNCELKESQNLITLYAAKWGEVVKELQEYKEKYTLKLVNNILVVEDGSIDVDKLNKYIDENDLGIYVLAYRQGARPPEFIKKVTKR